MKYLFLTLVTLVSFSCGRDHSHRIAKIPEASGISYCRNSDTLVVANDEGRYYEIDRNGKILRKKKLGKFDLEGVVCTDDHFIFAIEDEGLLFVNRKNGKKKTMTLNTSYHNKKLPLFDRKEGVEGIAKSGNTFYLAKQAKKKNDSFVAVVHIDRFQQKMIGKIKHKIPDTAGLTMYKDYLYMVSDKKDLLIRYDLKKKRVIQKIKLPKAAQEGIAFDGKGFVYIADDDGYVLKYDTERLGIFD